MSVIVKVMLLRVIPAKAMAMITKGLTVVRRPKHRNMTISQDISIFRKGAGS
jgi:hypothetical protein